MKTERRVWKGTWVWTEAMDSRGSGNACVWFRNRFEVPETGAALTVFVSADSRYRLFVNGESIGIGPCKGNAHTHYYETFELTPYLRPGTNVIAARVIHYGMGGPMTLSGPSSVWRSPWGGFVLDGELIGANGDLLKSLHTDETWRCARDPSYELAYDSWMSAIWLGGMERIDGSLSLREPQRHDYDDSRWGNAVAVMRTMNPHGVLAPWPLTARPIPMLYEKDCDFASLVRSSTGSGTAPAPIGACVLELPAGMSGWVELDAAELTTGYVRAELVGGEGAVVRLRYAEGYEGETVDGQRRKNVRDDYMSEGQRLVGDADEYRAAGHGTAERPEAYEPFWFRTFRYVRVEATAGVEPLRIVRVSYRETGYPMQVAGDFRCSDPSFHPLWDISLRTLRRCMHETYEDCPYYEQLQYAMDTALQALFTYSVSGDDRLARKAIHDYHSSRLPDGMLQCRFPTVEPQVIPAFALYWIGMLHDHYRWFGDVAFVRAYLPTADGVLHWFRSRLGKDGLVGAAEPHYWSFVDWVAEWPNGVPPANEEGPMTLHSLLFAATLQQAAELHEAVGRASIAEEYSELARRTNEAIGRLCWSDEQQLYRDGPNVEQYSLHAQLWSVLSGLSTGEDAKRLLHHALRQQSIAQVSYPMAYFLFRALSEAEMYNEAFKLWQPWHDMAACGLTTWAESPVGDRSDCHAWGALPLYEFPAELLGVKPGAPGFASIAVEPKPGPLRSAEGTAVTAKGPVHVRWERVGEGFRILVEGPAGVPTTVKLPDGSVRRFHCCDRIEVEI